MKQYTNYFVAFLDILGFKNLLGKLECQEIYDIFDVIHRRSSKTFTFNNVRIDAFEKMKCKILSDSVILYIRADIDDSFIALLEMCKELQLSLICREKPILLRGGIAYGKLFDEGDVIYGEGLAKAYLMESNLAKYPRIVFTEETLEIGKQVSKYMYRQFEPYLRVYDRDKDDLFFITYRPPYYMFKPETYKMYTDTLLSLCNSQLNHVTDASLREKYLWLKEWTTKVINMHGIAKEWYENERKEKREMHKKEIEERDIALNWKNSNNEPHENEPKEKE